MLDKERAYRCTRRYIGFSVAALICLVAAPATEAAPKIPAHFDRYASVDVGGGLTCVVGDVTDADAMNGRAYVYLEEASSHKVKWATKIPLAQGWYQNRATHCLADGGKILALVQSDTSSSQSLSQTLIDVVTLDKASGHIQQSEKVVAPGTGLGSSTWVNEGAENFRIEKGKVVVTGQFFNADDPDTRKPFTASPTP